MMHKRSVLARVVSAALLALTACHDLPTAGAPEITAPRASASLNQGQHLGQVPFLCTVSEYAPSSPEGWDTRRMTVFIPRGELHDAGRTVRYAYTRVFPSGRIFTVTHCDVPYTEGALHRVDRIVGVREKGGAEQFRARQDMVTTQQGCVTDGICPIAPIVITAPIKPVMHPELGDPCVRYPDECASGGGGWEGLDGGGNGEEDDGEGGLEGDADGDGDTLDDGPLAFAACVAVGIGVEGWISMGGAAYAGYKLFDARSEVRARYSEYRSYAESYTWREDYSPTVADLHYRNFLSAKDNEEALWVMLGSTGGVAVGKIGVAVVKCAPLLAAPTT